MDGRTDGRTDERKDLVLEVTPGFARESPKNAKGNNSSTTCLIKFTRELKSTLIKLFGVHTIIKK